MDKVMQHLQDIGYTTKQIHGAKPRDKLKLIANHLGVDRVPNVTKTVAKAILSDYISLNTKNKDTMSLLFQIHIGRITTSKGAPKHTDEHTLTISNFPSSKFYQTPEWRGLRYKVLRSQGNKCCVCGRSPKDGVVIHVDHIMPRSIYPELALDFNNMQVMCEDCNMGKGNKDNKRW